MTRIREFFCTASRFIVPAFFLILPYGFSCISSTASPNSDIFLSQSSLPNYLWFDIKNLEFPNLMTRIWEFFCTASRLVVPAVFLTLPHGFPCISSSASPNSDIFLSQSSFPNYLWFDIKKFEFPNPMTGIWEFFCTALRFIVPAFFLIPSYGFPRISSSASPNSDIFISQ